MRRLLFLLLPFLAINALAQTVPSIKLDSMQTYNSFLKQSIIKTTPAYFVDNKLILEPLMYNSLITKNIESVHVIKGDTLINNVKYAGKVYIKTKYNSLFKTTF